MSAGATGVWGAVSQLRVSQEYAVSVHGLLLACI